jgi:HSP20 family protein
MARIPFPSREQMSLDNLQNQFNNFIEKLWHGGISTPPFDGQDWSPALELRDEGRQFVVTIELPGVKRESVDIGAKATTLIIRGVKHDPMEDDGSVGRTLRSERRYGSFKRYIDLPEEIDVEQVNATMVSGVLHVTLPKVPAAQSTEVKITVREEAEEVSVPPTGI